MARKKPGVQGHLEAALKKYTSGKAFNLTEAEAEALFFAKDQEASGEAPASPAFTKAAELGVSYEEILAAAANGPNRLDRLEEKMKRGEITAKSAAVLNVFKDLVNISASEAQIRRSNRELSRLRRPGLPAPLRDDPALNNAIEQSQRGTLDAARAVEPIRQELDNQYAADQAVARDISGGQSSVYGGLSQLSSLRKRRGLNALVPAIDSIRAREQERLDALLQQRAAQRQNAWTQQFQNALIDTQQYNNDLAAASELGAIGRENLYGTLNNMAPSLATLAGYSHGARINVPNFRLPQIRLPRLRRYTGNKELDEYNDKVTNNLIGANVNYGRVSPVESYRPIDDGTPYGGRYR